MNSETELVFTFALVFFNILLMYGAIYLAGKLAGFKEVREMYDPLVEEAMENMRQSMGLLVRRDSQVRSMIVASKKVGIDISLEELDEAYDKAMAEVKAEHATEKGSDSIRSPEKATNS